MYAQVEVVTTSVDTVPVVPKAAVQTIADRSVVYVADAGIQGRFIERTIQTGAGAGDRIAVVSGIKPGESVVTSGSFYLRAERERLGLTGRSASREPAQAEQQESRVMVSEKGFEPDHLMLTAGVPARITFIRTTDATCAKEVVLPEINIRRELPLNTPVTVRFTPVKGDMVFACGINMFHGTITAR